MLPNLSLAGRMGSGGSSIIKLGVYFGWLIFSREGVGKNTLNKRPLGLRRSPSVSQDDNDVTIKDDNEDTDNSSQLDDACKRVIKPPVPHRPTARIKEKGIFRTSVTEQLKEWRGMYLNASFILSRTHCMFSIGQPESSSLSRKLSFHAL